MVLLGCDLAGILQVLPGWELAGVLRVLSCWDLAGVLGILPGWDLACVLGVLPCWNYVCVYWGFFHGRIPSTPASTVTVGPGHHGCRSDSTTTYLERRYTNPPVIVNSLPTGIQLLWRECFLFKWPRFHQ